jgi:hypothetical protein
MQVVSPAKHYHHTLQHHHQRNQALETWQRCTYSPIPLAPGELPTLQIRVQSCTKQHALLAPYSIPNAIATTKKQIDQICMHASQKNKFTCVACFALALLQT